MSLFIRNSWLLGLATILGALVGLEREKQGKSAGLRTHSLVCLGSALITLVSIYGFGPYADGVRDPARVAAQIVSGIGFLGAGTIMREGANIKGLTTAASLWTTAGIGLAIGAGLVVPAVVATAFVEIVLVVMGKVERRFIGRKQAFMRVVAVDRPGLLGEIATCVGECNMNILATDLTLDRENALVTIDITMSTSNTTATHSQLLQHLLSTPGVLRAELDNW
ncbi:MAG: MgtC/SapB family protein [Clostridia bacterium]|nr:MgtC/SapB family protein [Clostridia bacterium]